MAFALVLVFWPSLGFLNAIVGRPTSVWRAVGTGALTSILLMAVFSVLLGWMPLMRATNDDDRIRVLTNAIWPREDQSQSYRIKQATALFPGLEEIPQNERSAIVADRLRSDRLASAPEVLIVLLCFECFFMIPVVYGTAIGFWLLRRGQRTWIAYFRYLLAWWLSGVVIVVAGNAFSGVLFAPDAPISSKLIAIAILTFFIAALWLVMRRWKKHPRPETEPTIISSNATTG